MRPKHDVAADEFAPVHVMAERRRVAEVAAPNLPLGQNASSSHLRQRHAREHALPVFGVPNMVGLVATFKDVNRMVPLDSPFQGSLGTPLDSADAACHERSR